jgi:hypothetical protein
VSAKARCPYCGFEGEFKLLKTWKYAAWDVYFYGCPKCYGRFRWQVDPKGRWRSFVMKVGARKSALLYRGGAKNDSAACF